MIAALRGLAARSVYAAVCLGAGAFVADRQGPLTSSQLLAYAALCLLHAAIAAACASLGQAARDITYPFGGPPHDRDR